jgi:hypothetical protein
MVGAVFKKSAFSNPSLTSLLSAGYLVSAYPPRKGYANS